MSDGLSLISPDSFIKRTIMWHAKNIVNDMQEGSIKHWWIRTHGVNPCDNMMTVGQAVRPVISLVMMTCNQKCHFSK